MTTLQTTGAGCPSPTSDKACGANAGLVKAEEKGQADFAKEIATLQARFALAGLQLHQLIDGTLLMSRWGLSRVFNENSDAERFIASLGVK